MKHGTKKLGNPPKHQGGGSPIRKPKGGTVPFCYKPNVFKDSSGDKGRANDPNLDKVRSNPSNP